MEERESGEVDVGNVSRIEEGEEVRIVDFVWERVSAERERRATARFPWAGEERMRAMPVPWRGLDE